MKGMRLGLALLAVAGCARGNSGTVDSNNPGNGSEPGVTPDSGCGALPCDAVYVSRIGADFAPGTKDQPLKTIAEGISKAMIASPPLAVFVGAGQYDEQVMMKDGVTLYGGFDAVWNRGAQNVTEIDGPTPAVIFDGLTTPTALDQITVKSADAANG